MDIDNNVKTGHLTHCQICGSRNLELVLKRAGDLRDRHGLARAAYRQILRVQLAIAEHALAPHRQDDEQCEGQKDLYEERKKNGFDAHSISAAAAGTIRCGIS